MYYYVWSVYMLINIDGLNINYIDEGEGEAVLLIHGWGSSIKPWQPIMQGFEGKRIIALDLPGCGESDILKTPWELEDYCDFVLKFLDKIGVTNPIMVGHSHGGRIAIKMVAEGMLEPKKLILFDTAGIPKKKSFSKKVRIYTYKFIKGVLTLPFLKSHTEELLNKVRGKFGSADYKSAPPVMRETMVKVVNRDLRPIMPKIKCPTLLIWGECDTDTPLSDAKYMESRIPDCGLCVIKGADHFSFIRNPGQVIAILKSFLS